MRIRTFSTAAALGLALTTTVQAQAPRRLVPGSCYQALIERYELLVPEGLDEIEVAELIYLKEEEKLARDVYATLSLQHDVPVFSNIACAEQQHMRHVDLLLARYGIDDPVIDDAIGAFSNPGLATTFGDLVAIGRQSLEDALWVGATIEDLDLVDLYQLIDNTDNLDVAIIAQNLAAGSRNHLGAFVGQPALRGITYEGQYLTSTAVEDILESGHEHGTVYDEYGDVLSECGGRRSARIGDLHDGESDIGGDRNGTGAGRGSSGGHGTGECDGAGPHGSGTGGDL